MLGNQLFMAQKFEEAIPHFEQVVRQHPQDSRSRQRLIICHVIREQPDLALKNLKSLLTEPGPVARDWLRADENRIPIDILFGWLKQTSAYRNSPAYLLSAGILMLFHKLELAWSFLWQAHEEMPDNADLDEIIQIIAERKERALG